MTEKHFLRFPPHQIWRGNSLKSPIGAISLAAVPRGTWNTHSAIGKGVPHVSQGPSQTKIAPRPRPQQLDLDVRVTGPSRDPDAPAIDSGSTSHTHPRASPTRPPGRSRDSLL